ncbi:MAG: HAD-IIIA family hydrolase [Candidatus Berkelbacteria bacterium]|nr:HAD-IIIA family hydrolase [Candidatus Berkelbacteria bacterium]MCR4307381.1 HAD-IIIA family hydrolase [Candidatus Berkelbacteria bacterium]
MFRRYLSLRTPHQECTSILDMSTKGLSGAFLLIDVDNTICLRKTDEVDEAIISFLLQLRRDGRVKEICLLSNVVSRSQRRVDRVARIARKLQCNYVCAFWPWIKPRPEPYREALTKIGAWPEVTVMIGDQLLTDILGANKLGMRTVLVRPLGKDHFITRPRRIWERQVTRLRRIFNVTSPSS